MKRTKYAIVVTLEWLCGQLDNLPWVRRADQSWRSLRIFRHSCVGCYPLRLAVLSAKLDERWGTEAWRKR